MEEMLGNFTYNFEMEKKNDGSFGRYLYFKTGNARISIWMDSNSNDVNNW